MIWPAEVIVDIIHQYERYAEHDARFSPERLAELVGELLIRSDAIRRDTGAVPQLLIRGTASDRWTDLASARFIGLGCGVRQSRRLVTLTAYSQDANSGSIVAVTRDFPDPPLDSKDPAKPFWQLARTPVLKGASFAQVGAGQLLTQGGKRATNHELVLGRSKATVNPQNFSWENLRAPVLAESFTEVRSRLGVLPPASLRPRRIAEDYHVCPVAQIEQAGFDPTTQAIFALLKDTNGDRAILRHPYVSRGSEGAEHALARLAADSNSLRFVAGPMRASSEGLTISPTALVFQDDSTRTMLQPWIDRTQDLQTVDGRMDPAHGSVGLNGPVEELLDHMLTGVGDLIVVGLRRVDAAILRSWEDCWNRTRRLQMNRLATSIERLLVELKQKAATTRWDCKAAAKSLLDLSLVTRLSQDLAR